MPNVETIYQDSIRPLPVGDQMRLAEMIMERAREPKQYSGRRSALEIVKSARESMAIRSSADIDEYLRTERDSWDD